MHDIRLAFRLLIRTPMVSGVAIASLALGIGANTAIFSLVDQFLLRPLPVQEPDALVILSAPGLRRGNQECNEMGGCDEVFTYPMYQDLQRAQRGFTGIAGHRDFDANITAGGQTISAKGMLVSGNYFAVLGLTPAAGRLILPEDDAASGGSRVTVLSHDFWTTAFGANPDVVGRTIIVNGQSLTIVGVAPHGFRGAAPGMLPKLFVPLTIRSAMVPGWNGLESRTDYWLYLFGRLAPGVTAKAAAAQLTVPLRRILADVEAPALQGLSTQNMERFRNKSIVLTSGALGQSALRADTRTPLLMLMAATLFVLLIACLNISNLLLARGAARSTEMAVRLAIGGSRARLVRQLLTEALLLGLLGVLTGLAVATMVLQGLGTLLPQIATDAFVPQLDVRIIAFAAGLALTAAVLVGLFPALHATRPDLIGVIREQGGQSSGGHRAARWRIALATIQVTLATALLASAGLFAKSLVNVMQVDLGIKADHVLTFSVSPELNGYEPSRSHQLFARITDRVRALPGVADISSAMVPILSGQSWARNVGVEGFRDGPDVDDFARLNRVGAGFFGTLGVRVIAGREFTARDVAGSPKVAIVNEAFARKFGLGADPVGRRMDQGNHRLDTEIIGLVKDAVYAEVRDQVPPTAYIPMAQDTTLGSATFYVRTRSDPATMIPAVTAAVREIDPTLPLGELRTLTEQVRINVNTDRFVSLFTAGFATLATLLAAIGLYGVLAYTVAQRTREFGLRIALGAAPAQMRGLVMRQVAWMTSIGSVAGLVAALMVGRVAGSLLFGMAGSNMTVLAASVMVLWAVALTAGLVPALRAARLDPVKALRFE